MDMCANSYFESLQQETEAREEETYNEKLKLIMSDNEFKENLHTHCKCLIKDDPAQYNNIQAYNNFINKQHQIVKRLADDGECKEFKEIMNVTFIDLIANELTQVGNVAEDYAREVFDEYFEGSK